MVTLVIATRNTHKVSEIRTILGAGVRCVSLDDFPGAPEVVEDAGSFAGNATKKAVTLANWLGQAQSRGSWMLELPTEVYVLADDSGLEVDALGGAPGVHSARFAALDTGAAGNSATADNNAKLLRLLGDTPLAQRTGRFRCVLALAPVVRRDCQPASPVCNAEEVELQTELFEGACEGRIGTKLLGRGGFGYDPLFIPQGYEQTFGELPEEVKHRLSHRAKALAKLRQRLEHQTRS